MTASSNSGWNRVEQGGTLGIGHAPADHAAAENVQDDVEIVVAPLRWPLQFGDVPGPDCIGPFRQKFWLPVSRMTQLLAEFADFAVLLEQAVHGADRTMIDALIEQGGVDLGWCLIGEKRRMQEVPHPPVGA